MITGQRIRQFAVIMLIWLFCLPHAEAEPVSTVETVSVSIMADNAALPSRVAKRMEASVGAVGEQVLAGRRVEDIADNRTAYEQLIQEVFNRVLVGYSVSRVNVEPGTATYITVSIVPWGDVVKQVDIEIDPLGLDPQAAALIRQDAGNIDGVIRDGLLGLPVDAVDWAGSIARTVVRDTLADRLPEFRTAFEITPGTRTVVKLSLIPAGRTIQDTSVSLRSQTIPNLLLGNIRPTMEEQAKVLHGLPVDFVARHRDYFAARLLDAVGRYPWVRRYGLKLDADLNVGSLTDVNIRVETDKYRVTLEGNLDFGRTTDSASFKLHAGQFVGSRDELFTQVDFIPSSVTWTLAPGWEHRIGTDTWAGFRYDTGNGRFILQLNQQIGRNWNFRVERTPARGYNEFGLRYKLHDFLSTEYVFTTQEKYLRLTADL